MTLTGGKLSIGRDEHYWDDELLKMSEWDAVVPLHDILVLAPHPDDEVLGCGGALQRWWKSATALEVRVLTDGEACFGEQGASHGLARRRRAEVREAHRRLGIGTNDKHLTWSGFPDGRLSEHRRELYAQLSARVDTQTTLIAPLSNEGHPDHDIVGQVAHDLVNDKGLLLVSYPVWLWHLGDAGALQALGTACRVELTAAEQCRKREAIAAFGSQIRAEQSEPLLPRRVLRHFRRPFEVFFMERPVDGERQGAASL